MYDFSLSFYHNIHAKSPTSDALWAVVLRHSPPQPVCFFFFDMLFSGAGLITKTRYMPDSPDTFYAKVQPLSSDSAHTPPSPIASRPRRSSARPSQQSQAPTQTPPGSNHGSASNNALRRSTTTISTGTTHSYTSAPTQQVRKERERQLANTPRDTLIHLAISKEHEIKEAKHLLTTAILQIESLRDKLTREEQARKVLEEEKRLQGLKTTQAILKAQKESMGAVESVGTYKLQIENLQMELSVIFFPPRRVFSLYLYLLTPQLSYLQKTSTRQRSRR